MPQLGVNPRKLPKSHRLDNVEACPACAMEVSVLLRLCCLCPSAVTTYLNVLEVLTSKLNKLNRVDLGLVAAEVSSRLFDSGKLC